jgi:homogentisate 1,2-dioxygenase
MPRYLTLGSIPKKRHTAHRTAPGYRNEGIYYEEVISTQGFSRAYSIAYHLRPPTRVTRVEPAGNCPIERIEQPTLRHHHIKTGDLPRNGDPVTGRVPVLANNDVTLWRCRPNQPQGEFYRNAIAEEILFVHKGSGKLLTQLGALPFKPFDYVVIPRCTTYQITFDAGSADLLVIESAGVIDFPRRYLNPDGQLKLGAPYCERDLHGPAQVDPIDREGETSILIKDGSRLTRYILAHHPFDVIGWDGCVYPFTFNADDFESITGTVHQPPPSIRHLNRLAVSWSARSHRGCSTRTRTPSRFPMRTRMSKAMRYFIMCGGSSAADAASRNRRSRFIRMAFRTGRIPARSSPART